MIKAIAIDDEPLALDVIQEYCQSIDGIQLKQTFVSQDKALDYLNNTEVDLIFLDIRMPKSNGIQLYNSLTQKIRVIFTTAFSEYAVEGFNLSAIDYLLKPFSLERFSVAVEKVKKDIGLELKLEEKQNYLMIKADYKLYNIPLEKIVFIEALDDYVKIHLVGQSKIVARHTMKGILNKLPVKEFQRVHRSYIISVNKIDAIKKDSIELEEFTIPISTTYKDKFLKFINT
ncbi:LytR/AlgR family response regulator transcription factor [Maribacter sp. IgM3_T14_3]|uniref:LytR/AlgR family response regulator transcription factor n=1 Tax=Maribacter sp. IgM3_T14_3 TaxID=3415140 RepID=UPI003C6FF2AC